MKHRRFLAIGLMVLFSMALFIAIYVQAFPNRNAPLAMQGVLDLSNWDFEKEGWIPLDGQWEYYPEQLLEPGDFLNGEVNYLAVPGIWRGKQNNSMDRQGFGTYRLRVIVRDSDEILGLKVRSIRMSHKLYINGKVVGGSGLPAADVQLHQPGNTPYTTYFHTNAHEVEIVIQTANYVYVNGGIVNSIQMGLNKHITMLNSLQMGSDLAVILILGMFGSYHLSFYFLGRKEKTYILSGLYLLILMCHQSLYGEKLFMRLLPDVPFNISYKLLDLSEFVSEIVIILFFCSLDKRLLKSRKIALLLLPIGVYIVSVLVLPYRMHSEIKPLFLLYIGILSIYLIGRMMLLLRRQESDPVNRTEIFLFIGGIISLTVFMMDGVLFTINLVPTDLIAKLGVISFIVFMNMFLAVRFANAYEKTETLSNQLKISNQLKDEFLTYTSHEIKTPLHGIMNMTTYLLDDTDGNLTTKQKQNLWLIKDTSIKLSMLIHDLIDVTRLKHGELRLYPVVVDVRVVVQIVFDVLQFELLGKAVRFENAVSQDVWVRADENRLRQIIYNLVHNAIKHTDQGLIKVISNVEGESVFIFVEDTGVGIPKDKHEAIFNYFEQLNETLPNDEYTGMGVGLYISRKLVEQMEGQLKVERSQVGQGTCMMLLLPRADMIPAYHEAAYTSEPQRDSMDQLQLDITNQKGHTIMVVDDEASNIHVLHTILERNRYNVLTAFSAKEALTKLGENKQVDLVILDVMMPGISGIELCQLLRSQYSIIDLPILFTTAKDTSQDISMGFRAGANDYVTKPFDAETLVARIQTHISMKTSIQEAIRNEHAFHQAQIKPHFLYNALSSVISFCYTDGKKAAYLLGMLSQYLRFILDMDRSTLFVPLYRELELIRAYIEIEKARFGDRFDFECFVDNNLLNYDVPSLCIQPFVENAIRHGLFEKDGVGKVGLHISEGQGYMKVTIEDDGIGIPDDILYEISTGEMKEGGIAIANIRKRLNAIPGATFSVSSELGKGTKITMYLPLYSDEPLVISKAPEQFMRDND